MENNSQINNPKSQTKLITGFFSVAVLALVITVAGFSYFILQNKKASLNENTILVVTDEERKKAVGIIINSYQSESAAVFPEGV